MGGVSVLLWHIPSIVVMGRVGQQSQIVVVHAVPLGAVHLQLVVVARHDKPFALQVRQRPPDRALRPEGELLALFPIGVVCPVIAVLKVAPSIAIDALPVANLLENDGFVETNFGGKFGPDDKWGRGEEEVGVGHVGQGRGNKNPRW